MKAVVQRIKSASVTADGQPSGTAAEGLLILLGVYETDNRSGAELLASKVSALRVFCDENGKMNRSVLDIGGSVLTVSNFTLCADIKKGNRPSFMHAMEPNSANSLYEYFIECLKIHGVKNTPHGEFGADMQIDSVLDGPITIIMDTDIWAKNN